MIRFRETYAHDTTGGVVRLTSSSQTPKARPRKPSRAAGRPALRPTLPDFGDILLLLSFAAIVILGACLGGR